MWMTIFWTVALTGSGWTLYEKETHSVLLDFEIVGYFLKHDSACPGHYREIEDTQHMDI